jgi:arylsulfatase
MSDNGGTRTQLFDGGMRGSKATPYQGGTHAICFWHWPGRLFAGKDVDRLAAHIDVLPTLAALTGAALPRGLALDGRSLVPLLQDAGAPWSDRFLFIHVGRWEKGAAEAAKYGGCAIRNQRFRFVNNKELYDLQADPGETRNVVTQHPEMIADMRRAYDGWWIEARRGMVNEEARGPDVNPFKSRYWRQFGGGPN